jgi:hypothetical protein
MCLNVYSFSDAKHLRVYWRQLNDHISALDELNMCKLRLRVRFPHEPQMKTKQSKTKAGKQPLGNLSSNLENKVETIYIIEEHEVSIYLCFCRQGLTYIFFIGGILYATFGNREKHSSG